MTELAPSQVEDGIGRLDYWPRAILMHCDTEAERSMRIQSCAKEPETIAFIEAMPPGSVFYDIGANTGAYSLVAWALGHNVVAFEPVSANYARLCQNLRLNGARITALPVACSSEDRVGVMGLSSEDTGAALHAFDGPGETFEPCLGMRLDTLRLTFGLPAPTHVKIDTDGHEYHVVRGGTWSGVQAVQIERDPECPDTDRAISWLEGFGLKVVRETPHASGVSNVWLGR